eukprot:2791866-Pyramimonas_sp.AAC.2
MAHIYFPCFLLAVLSSCRSEVHASSPILTRTTLRRPSGDTQNVTGPVDGSVVSGHPSSTIMSGCTPLVGGLSSPAPSPAPSSGGGALESRRNCSTLDPDFSWY